MSRKNPEKQNVNPWNPSEKIYCTELATKYYDCIEREKSSDRPFNIHNKCNSLIKLTSLCFQLDEKEFLNAANDEGMEDYYLDMYIQKQLRQEDIIKTIPKF
jgi:hypothetical protein